MKGVAIAKIANNTSISSARGMGILGVRDRYVLMLERRCVRFLQFVSRTTLAVTVSRIMAVE